MNHVACLRDAKADHRFQTDLKRITAEVIECPGQLSNDTYCALQVNIEGFESPYVLTLALRAVGYRALAERADPAAVYGAIAAAVNEARVAIEMNASSRVQA